VVEMSPGGGQRVAHIFNGLLGMGDHVLVEPGGLPR
jgi:hypothetical protein